jgi:hypothetical protein
MHYGLNNVETGYVGGCTPRRLFKTQRCKEELQGEGCLSYISEAEFSMVGIQSTQNLLIFKSTSCMHDKSRRKV